MPKKVITSKPETLSAQAGAGFDQNMKTKQVTNMIAGLIIAMVVAYVAYTLVSSGALGGSGSSEPSDGGSGSCLPGSDRCLTLCAGKTSGIETCKSSSGGYSGGCDCSNAFNQPLE